MPIFGRYKGSLRNEGETLGLYQPVSINVGDDLKIGQEVEVSVSNGTKFSCKLRLDTDPEVTYYKNGGILQYVLRKLI